MARHSMMSPSQCLTFPNELPPFSPIVYRPKIKYPFPFETEYSREPTRIRAVFDKLVEKAKEMNLGKPQEPNAKRRARSLGLKVDIEQAKGLHWRSIQARHPVILTAGPISPRRTPRRPAMDYPTAEQLCLKNMVDAQKRQNFAEASRWSYFTERERAISKWEAEQEAVFHARQSLATQASAGGLSKLSPLERQTPLGYGDSEWEKTLSPTGLVASNSTLTEKRSRIFADPRSIYDLGGEPPFQAVIEMPAPLMDRSQDLRPEAANTSYTQMTNSQMQSFSIPRGTDPSLWNARLSRSSSIQRHIPAASLRMAPMPLHPKIDHSSLSYPTPQATRLSYAQPADKSASVLPQNSLGIFGYAGGSSVSGLTSNQTATIPLIDPVVPERGFIDESSLKKRRAEAEHHASLKIEQRKLR